MRICPVAWVLAGAVASRRAEHRRRDRLSFSPSLFLCDDCSAKKHGLFSPIYMRHILLEVGVKVAAARNSSNRIGAYRYEADDV